MGKEKIARLAESTADYRRMGLKKNKIEQWEDGKHTSGRFGEYEWWYFDGKMDDGSSLVIVFYTQPVTAATPGYAPSMTLSLTRPDGTHIEDAKGFKMKDCLFADNFCAVKMGRSGCEGDLQNYKIHYETEVVTADVTLKANAASWRPGTGRILFGEKHYFAWLPSVPEGKMEAVVTLNGETIRMQGTGYHDHNWGDTGMFWLMHHWYWGRARVGDYQAITSFITAHKKYGYEKFMIFLLLKNGVKIGDNPDCVTYTQEDPELEPVTGKHFHRTIIYDYNDGTQHYRITYRAEKVIETFCYWDAGKSIQAKAGPALLWLVEKVGLSPSYIRVNGTITLERFEPAESADEGNGGAENVAETVSAPGIWEQMHFGLDEDV